MIKVPPDKTALVIGATSDIGRALARKLASYGYTLQLAGRDSERIQVEIQDIRVRTGMIARSYRYDLLDEDFGLSILDTLEPLPDVAVCLVGLLGNQAENTQNMVAAEMVIRTNYVGPALLMGELAARFELRGSGVLVGVSSVAGERGRASNYVYGSAKAGFTTFLSGLRNRLAATGVHVVTVKPGFVFTRMTDGMKLPIYLTAMPEEVADAITAAIHARRNIVYVRRIWRMIMFAIRALPEWAFKRMKL